MLKTLLSAFNHTQKSPFGLLRIHQTNFMALTWTFLSTSFLAIGVIAWEQAHNVWFQEQFWRSSCQRAMNSDFSSRDKGSASKTFPNLAPSECARRVSAQRSIDLRNRYLLAATESDIKFIGWPITSQRGVLAGSVMYSLDEFQGWIQSCSSDFQKSLKCFQTCVCFFSDSFM